MTEEATEKQVKFATSLGIQDPSTFSKQALKELIQKKLDERDGNKPKTFQNAPTQSNVVQETIVRQIPVMPHSYEFGKAGARHKIYYGKIEELMKHLEELKKLGLADDFESVPMNL